MYFNFLAMYCYGSVYGSSDYKIQSELYTQPLHCLLLSPIEWLHEVQCLVNFTIFSTTPQFFQIIQAEIGDIKKTISDTWFQL